jgi:hypothetical protein
MSCFGLGASVRSSIDCSTAEDHWITIQQHFVRVFSVCKTAASHLQLPLLLVESGGSNVVHLDGQPWPACEADEQHTMIGNDQKATGHNQILHELTRKLAFSTDLYVLLTHMNLLILIFEIRVKY